MHAPELANTTSEDFAAPLRRGSLLAFERPCRIANRACMVQAAACRLTDRVEDRARLIDGGDDYFLYDIVFGHGLLSGAAGPCAWSAYGITTGAAAMSKYLTYR
jgi:hypothetical protein